MSGIVFDSSVYINSGQKGEMPLLAARRIDFQGESLAVYLSSVVLAELYSGADTKSRKLISKFEHDFSKVRRLLIPSKSDWGLAGKTLYNIGKEYGFEMIGRSRMMNDCLIAMTASRLGLSLATGNVRDFQIISEFHPLKLREL